MEELNRELKRRHQNGDITGMVPVHNEFHEIFVNACGNERLAQLIRNLVNQFQRYRIALSHTEAIDESIRVHEQIVDAFRMRDSRKVTELVGMNSSQGGENLINSISCLN